MAKARKTGLLPVSSKEPYYGDFSSAVDFHMAQNRLIQAKESFDALPVNIRKKFGYDAGRLMEFLENPENEAEAVKLGLLKAKAPSAEDLAAQKAAADAARKDALKADLAALGVKLA